MDKITSQLKSTKNVEIDEQLRNLYEKLKSLEMNNQNLIYISTILFIILNLPQVYHLMNKLFHVVDKKGCPTMSGVIVHAIVFFVLMKIITSFFETS